MQFQAVVKDLSSSELSEREISKKIVNGILYIAELGGDLNKPNLIRLFNRAKNILLKTRPGNAFMGNILNYLLYDIETAKDVRKEMKVRCERVEQHFNLVADKITRWGNKKIKNNSKIFILGHSKLILNLLKKAKEDGKNFVVNNIELRPEHLGRIMADEISKIGVYVNHYPDSAMNYALEGCDLALIDGFSIYNNKLISNTGAKILADVCEKEEIPIYTCIDGWRFGKKINKRDKKFWNKKPDNVNLVNPGFEEIDLSRISVISELGILNGRVYLEHLKSTYPWITSSF